jgi:UDP-glucose 4-epimerase
MLHPTDVNGINKMAGEWYHILYNNVHGISACALRLTNTYGPRMRVRDARQTFVGLWLRQVVQGEDIKVFGDGGQLRDFNYVDDVTEAFLLAAVSKNAYGRVFNLGSDDPTSLKDLADLLVELNGGGTFSIVPFPEDKKRIDIGDYYADFQKITSELGWQPRTSLRNGLRLALKYYRKYGKYYWDE